MAGPAERRPVWPVTLLVVCRAYLLAAWNLFGAVISVAYAVDLDMHRARGTRRDGVAAAQP